MFKPKKGFPLSCTVCIQASQGSEGTRDDFQWRARTIYSAPDKHEVKASL